MSAADVPRLEVVGSDGVGRDLFEVVTFTDAGFRVRAPVKFEIGEVLTVRIARGAARSDGRVRVARHVDDGAAVITALDLLEEIPVRTVVTG
ncbi:MAG: hypothetical protein R2939_02325 [Kofleriaceae bacterium]